MVSATLWWAERQRHEETAVVRGMLGGDRGIGSGSMVRSRCTHQSTSEGRFGVVEVNISALPFITPFLLLLYRMPKPSYICIGTQKAGTTALGAFITKHPEIYCDPREPHYFDQRYALGDKWYTERLRTNKRIVGEKTPSYCNVPTAMKRIKEYNPMMKLVFMVREPVSRLWSQFKMECRVDGVRAEEPLLRRMLAEQDVRLVDMVGVSATQSTQLGRRAFCLRSRYGELLQNVYSLFSREQVLVVVYEELIADPLTIGNQIATFLGATQPFPEGTELLKANVGGYTDSPSPALAKTARMRLRDDTELFYRMIGRRIPAWDAVHAAMV